MSLESCLHLTTKILVDWVIFADVTLVICMHLVMSCAPHLWHSLVSALAAIHSIWSSFPPIFALIDSCYSPMGGWCCEVADCLGSDSTWEIMLCSWVLWFVELGCWHGCCWNFDYRFHSFLGAVSVPPGIGCGCCWNFDYRFCSFLGAVLVPCGIGCGCSWNSYDRFHSFLGAVSVPCGIGMILFGSDKNKADFVGKLNLSKWVLAVSSPSDSRQWQWCFRVIESLLSISWDYWVLHLHHRSAMFR
jgi:hypothetical protein